ncbi:hypothetical protein D3C71_1100520 [compost metagenome]
MDLSAVIANLTTATSASRFLDSQIAQAIGWKKVRNSKGDGSARNRWYPPGSDEAAICPFFTSNFDDAYALSIGIDPHHAAAFVREGNSSRAQFEGGEPCYGPTPQIALCIAALTHMQRLASTL